MRYNPQKRAAVDPIEGLGLFPAGGYYVTIVVKKKRCEFGRVVAETLNLSELGRVADACWREIPKHHEDVGLDEHVVMPNHVHGIVIINEKSSRVVGRDVQLNFGIQSKTRFILSGAYAINLCAKSKDALRCMPRAFFDSSRTEESGFRSE
jgi:hypothetical protein